MTEKVCVRCGSKDGLEEDHILMRSRGGPDTGENKRWLCSACHDYRHARDQLIEEINKWTKGALNKAPLFDPNQLSLWLFRLGVLEAYNTPEIIYERKTYMSYFDINATHISAWKPIVAAHALRRIKQLQIIIKDRQAVLASPVVDKMETKKE